MLHSEGQAHRLARSAVLPAFRAADPRMPAEVEGRYAELRGSRADGTPCDPAKEFCVPMVARATIDLLGCEDAVTPAPAVRPHSVPRYRGWWYGGPSAVLASWNWSVLVS